jgi:tripartite-type tricarboxylate transporter receptor subunit TctC
MRMLERIVGAAIALVATLAVASELRADPIADFYQGNTIHLLIGYGEGGGYDIYGRLVTEFLGRHIPGNPTIVPQNLPGAGSFKAVEYLYGAAPKNGTYLGTVAQTLPMDAIVEHPEIDVTKLPYIGRVTTNIDVGVALPSSGIKSFADLQQREVTAGSSGGGSTSVLYPLALNAYAGAKIKLVRGYSGSNEVELAQQRGEVVINPAVGIPGILTSHPDWLKGAVVILYQNALQRFRLLPQVPTLPELAQSDEGRAVMRAIAGTAELGRSVLTTPDVPPERLAALRTAFQEMLKDPDFIGAADKRHMTLDPAGPDELDAITKETMALPKPIVDSLGKLLKE